MSRSSEPEAFTLIAGGGTGGHVYPALAVAHELVRRGHAPETLVFVGTKRGLEAQAVPDAGFGIELLPGRGLRRALTPRALVANIVAICAATVACIRALRVVGRARPRAVLGVGGYASLPCVVAGWLRRVPLVVHEQNVAPGLTNRIAARLGARAAVSLPDTPIAGAVLTGNPIRPEILGVVPQPESPPLVAIVGGSLGARRLNDAALALYEQWRDRSDVAVWHVSGRRDHDTCTKRLEAMRRPDDRLVYTLVEYEEQMSKLYTRASLMVCRSGAVTVAELAATRMPAVLVPFPGATDHHQERNAAALVRAGAAVGVDDSALDGARLASELDALLGDPDRRRELSVAIGAFAMPDAAGRVADLVEEAARGAA